MKKCKEWAAEEEKRLGRKPLIAKIIAKAVGTKNVQMEESMKNL